jgi:hypothetical protein
MCRTQNNASGNGGNGLGGEEQISNNTPKYDSFFLKNEEVKVKELWGCLADIHTLLHMPIELFRHASNNNTKADTTTDTKQAVDFAEAYKCVSLE